MRPAAWAVLMRKEARSLLPLVAAVIALEILGLFDWFISRAPDEASWSELSVLADTEMALGVGIAHLILGIIAAYMLFPHERDQRTLALLWSLPASRWLIYVGKLLTAFAVLSALIVAGHLLLLWLVGEGASSVGRAQFRWDVWRLELAALLGLTAISLGYGALVAQFRVLGILGLIVLWSLALYLSLRVRGYDFVNPATLLQPEYRGTDILLSGKAWLTHALAALGAAVLAGFLWTRDDAGPATVVRRSRIRTHVVNAAAGAVAVLLILAYGAGSLLPVFQESGTSTDGRPLQNLVTRHFDFSFFAEDNAAAQALARDADGHARAVMKLLDVETNRRIVADLTDDSVDHLGIAGWNKLRMQRDSLYGDEGLRTHVLVHETVHVLSMIASDRRLGEHAAYAQFFSEGVAEWAAYETVGLEDQRQALRALSALAWNRFELDFAQMMDALSFRSRYDQNLVYALGEAWVATLADVCGETAPAAVLAAMGRADAPQSLTGVAFWRDTLQAAGCDLARVNAQFDLMLGGLRDELSSVPAVTSGATADGDLLRVTVTVAKAEPVRIYYVHVRVRDSAQVSSAGMASGVEAVATGSSATFEFPASTVSGERFQYQVGLEFLDGERPFYGPWLDAG